MPWAALDDTMCFHAKILVAGNEAIGAWARGISWSAQHQSDGRVPRAVAVAIAPEVVWERLVSVRLCEPIPIGWQIHDYTDWNWSAKKIKLESRRKAANMRAFRERTVTGNLPVSLPARNRSATAASSSSSSSSSDHPIQEKKESAPVVRAPTPTLVDHPDPDIQALARAIAADPMFSSLDALRIAKLAMPVGKRLPLPWLLCAVREASDKLPDGSTHDVKHRWLVGCLKSAKEPRVSVVSAAALTPEQKAQWEDEKRRLRGAHG